MDLEYLPVVLASFGVSASLYYFISPLISEYICNGYRKLTQEQQVDWNTRTVSTLHSLIVSSLCVYVLLHDDDSQKNPIWCKCKLAKYNCAITAGYVVADLMIMLCHFPLADSVFYILHHLAAVYAYTYTLLYGALPYFANFRLIAEVSTPFVNERWFLDVLGYPKDNVYLIFNGVAMSVSFFMVRIAVMPTYYYTMYSVWGTPEFYELSSGMRVAWVLASAVLDTINVYWFSKIYRGLKKLLLKKQPELNNKKAA
ncbi:TLC domain-containing protein 4-B-like [Glandiceps talaboti]